MPAIRATLLTEIPAPFRIPLFNALAADPEIELEVLFLSLRDPKRPYPLYADEFRFNWSVLPGRELLRRGRWIVFSWGVPKALRGSRPSVLVIGGWNQPAFWWAAAYGRLARVPVIVWVESTARDARSRSRLTGLFKQLLVRTSAGYIVPGQASAEYLEALGVSPTLITTAPNAVDPIIFQARVEELRSDQSALRSELEIEGPLVLFVGRLDREKGVDLLLQAAQGLPATIALIGRGPDEESFRAIAPSNVRFEGWVPRDELARWYAAADIFVLPSRSDQWGMVLNEAAAAGLPLVATEAVGAAHDLIDDGMNGFRVRNGDATGLRTALDRLLADQSFCAAAGARSRELAATHTPEHWARAVTGILRRTVSDRKPLR